MTSPKPYCVLFLFILTSCSILGVQKRTSIGKKYVTNREHWHYYEHAQRSIEASQAQRREEFGTQTLTWTQKLQMAREKCEAYEPLLENAPNHAPGNFATAQRILTEERKAVCRRVEQIENQEHRERVRKLLEDRRQARVAKNQAIREKELKAREQMTNQQIRKLLIQQSQQRYSGNCPCPYFVDARGRSCGRRSAYSRRGGRTVLCYTKDVSSEMIHAYRLGQK